MEFDGYFTEGTSASGNPKEFPVEFYGYFYNTGGTLQYVLNDWTTTGKSQVDVNLRTRVGILCNLQAKFKLEHYLADWINEEKDITFHMF